MKANNANTMPVTTSLKSAIRAKQPYKKTNLIPSYVFMHEDAIIPMLEESLRNFEKNKKQAKPLEEVYHNLCKKLQSFL